MSTDAPQRPERASRELPDTITDAAQTSDKETPQAGRTPESDPSCHAHPLANPLDVDALRHEDALVADPADSADPSDPAGRLERPESGESLVADMMKVLGGLARMSPTRKGQKDSPAKSTPPAGMLGVTDEATHPNPSGFTEEGLAVFLLGVTRPELDASAWAQLCHNHCGGLPPSVDSTEEIALGNVISALSEVQTPDGHPLVRGAHDVSTGGLLHALVTMVARFGVGGAFDVTAAAGRDGVDDCEMLFSESPTRAVIALNEAAVPVLVAATEAEGVACERIGVTGGDLMVLAGSGLLAEVGYGNGWVMSVDELRELSE